MGEVVLQRVWKRYRQVEAVKDLTLTIHDGEFFCILGPSGCGKTSTLRMIAGLEEISAGDIFIGDERINDLEPGERNVALAFESYALYPHLSAHENIAFPLRVRGVRTDEVASRVRQVAEMLHLTEVLQQRPATLSGGQQQRLTLARALVRDAVVYLLDEPLSHLDAQERVLLRVEMKRIQELKHLTFVLVTHDQLEAMTTSDRIAIMNQGILQQVGTPDEVFERPANLFVADFVGEPAINLLPGRLQADGDRLFVQLDGNRVGVPAAYRRPLEKARAEEVVVGVRPPYVLPCDLAEEGALRGEVYMFESIGDVASLTTRIGPAVVRAELPPGVSYALGRPVGVRFDPSHILIFEKSSGARVTSETERR